MPKFQEPSIHNVICMVADVTRCNEGTDNEFGCLNIAMLGADDKRPEVQIYFNHPYHAMAQKYADAINAVRP